MLGKLPADVRKYRLNIFGVNGHVDKVNVLYCATEVEAVLEALAVLDVQAVELKRGKRSILRVVLPAKEGVEKPQLIA